LDVNDLQKVGKCFSRTKKIRSNLLRAISIGMMAQDREPVNMPDIRNKIYLERLLSEPSPVITEPWATIIFRGIVEDVELIGEMTGWQARGLKLKPIVGTDARSYAMPFLNDARIEYKLLIDGEWHLDGLNPSWTPNELGGRNSYFTMPRYKPNPWAERNPENPRGRVEGINTDSSQLQVYLPPDYDIAQQDFPTLYLINGQEYIRNLPVDVIVDNLIAANQIRPLIIFFGDTGSESKNSGIDNLTLDRMMDEMIPSIENHYRMVKAAESRAVAGSGWAGMTAAIAATHHPEVFGKVLSQSAVISSNHFQLIDEALSKRPKKLEWFIEVGRYESMLDTTRQMKELLESNGQIVGYREFSAGHNWTHWKDALSDGLIYLYPYFSY
jgi:enterochelin esterase family protein